MKKPMTNLIPANEVTFRSSGCGNLKTGKIGLTDKQEAYLSELQNRQQLAVTGAAKPLTANMKVTLQDLIDKRDAPPELSETAKRFVEQSWLLDVYGYRKIIATREMMKGHLCEQDSIGLVSELWESEEFRIKNTRRLYGQYFQGTPDVILKNEGIIEDVKTSWDLRTFFEVREEPELYYCQGQCYMHLFEVDSFRLHYCLVDTPDELLMKEAKSLFFKYGKDEDNPHYQEAVEQLYTNHKVSHIPAHLRIKTFEFKYDEEYVTDLIERVGYAREYYSTLTLNMKKKKK